MVNSANVTSETLAVALYSDDRTVRSSVRLALGRRVAEDLPELVITEFATPNALFAALDTQHWDLAILDGEAVPEGGMGIAHQMKDELQDPPPVVLLLARAADAWLATWSRAEAIAPYPIDPIRLPNTVAQVLRARLSGSQVMMGDVTDQPSPGVSSSH